MLKILGAFLFVFLSSQICLAWHNRACFVNRLGYVQKIMQETMYEIENNVKFCNLNLQDFNQTINDQMYSFRVSGLAQYTNGFLISVQSMDVNAISSLVTRRFIVASNVTEYEALVRATLNLRGPRVGFDVRVDLDDIGVQHYTGVYQFDSIDFAFWILKNINTNVTTVSTANAGHSARFQTMNFIPNTNVSQVLSRHVQGSNMGSSFTSWGHQILVPIIQKLADTKMEFPEIRFDGC